MSKYKKEHRYLFEIRFYGEYKDDYWVDALSMTKTPPFPNDGGLLIHYYIDYHAYARTPEHDNL